MESMESIDIRFKDGYPSCELSNFSKQPFIFDGVKCASREGFLQSLKCKNLDTQEKVCKLFEYEAKLWGDEHGREWKKTQTLWWRGKEYNRHSDEYFELVSRAFFECSKQNDDFAKALLSTEEKKLTHSIGKKDPFETILTEDEFCLLLTNLRSKWEKSNELKQLFILFVLGLIVGLCLYFYIGASLMIIFALIGTNAFVAAIYYSCKLHRHCMKLEKK